MANMFRLLRADEIDVRIGNTNKGKTKANLLLYKDARCDMAVLDETVGPFNWTRSHSRDNANCTVSIWDEKKAQWISKEDTGTESRTEAEKGLASDSFKRACFNWGIGRELYTAPQIWVSYDPNKYESYTVAEIGYGENREINRLSIADKSGVVIFRYGNTVKNHVDIKTEPAPDDAVRPGDAKAIKEEMQKKGGWDVRKQIQIWCERMGINGEQFNSFRTALIKGGVCKNIKYDDYEPLDLENLFEAIRQNYPDMLKGLTA